MVLTNDELLDVWSTTKIFDTPSIVKGVREDNVFYTIEDGRSIIFFIPAIPIESKSGYRKLKKGSLYRVYAIAKSKCFASEKFIPSTGEVEEVWEMIDNPIPVNCNEPFNPVQKFVKDEIMKIG